jgi:hypothetical protein
MTLLSAYGKPGDGFIPTVPLLRGMLLASFKLSGMSAYIPPVVLEMAIAAFCCWHSYLLVSLFIAHQLLCLYFVYEHNKNVKDKEERDKQRAAQELTRAVEQKKQPTPCKAWANPVDGKSQIHQAFKPIHSSTSLHNGRVYMMWQNRTNETGLRLVDFETPNKSRDQSVYDMLMAQRAIAEFNTKLDHQYISPTLRTTYVVRARPVDVFTWFQTETGIRKLRMDLCRRDATDFKIPDRSSIPIETLHGADREKSIIHRALLSLYNIDAMAYREYPKPEQLHAVADMKAEDPQLSVGWIETSGGSASAGIFHPPINSAHLATVMDERAQEQGAIRVRTPVGSPTRKMKSAASSLLWKHLTNRSSLPLAAQPVC